MTRADAVELWKISRAALAMRNSAGTSGYAQLTAASLRHPARFRRRNRPAVAKAANNTSVKPM